MRYKLLGRTGLRVSELCLGTMTFGEEWGWGASREESRGIFDAFADAGGNFVDTANLYTGGTSEKFVGEFLKGRRQRFVLATKYTLNMAPDDPNGGGNHRKNLVQSLDASLKRLDTDYIDLYWVHAWDGMTPLDETMRALDDVVRAGKVLYVGISDAPAWVVSRANTLAELKDWSPFAALQIQYSLADRSPERDLLPIDAQDLRADGTAQHRQCAAECAARRGVVRIRPQQRRELLPAVGPSIRGKDGQDCDRLAGVDFQRIASDSHLGGTEEPDLDRRS